MTVLKSASERCVAADGICVKGVRGCCPDKRFIGSCVTQESINFARVGTAVPCLPSMKSQCVYTPAVLAILQTQQAANTPIFSSVRTLDLLAIRPFRNSKCHFLNGNRRQPPSCLAKSETDERKSMAAKPFILTIDFRSAVLLSLKTFVLRRNHMPSESL